MNPSLEKALKYTTVYVIPFLALLLSFAAIFIVLNQSQKIVTLSNLAQESKTLAQQANDVAAEARVLAQSTLPPGTKVENNFIVTEDDPNVVLEIQSVDSAEEAFGVIYNTPEYNALVYDHLKPRVAMENTIELREMMNVFESVGNAYCAGDITTAEIQVYLSLIHI